MKASDVVLQINPRIKAWGNCEVVVYDNKTNEYKKIRWHGVERIDDGGKQFVFEINYEPIDKEFENKIIDILNA